jgi:diacylglycerol kinase
VKAAKDVAAGAVLVTSIAAAAIGVMIFWPYIAAQVWPPLR